VKRRVEESGTVPPIELTDYQAWSLSRGLAPFGHPSAVAQCRAWQEERREWAQAHGLDDLDMGPGPWPFDAEMI
jgi:hypothetical protein